MADDQRCLITALPEELIDYILLELSFPQDLLAASLTCKKFSALIEQEQLNYCSVRIDLVRFEFWEHLANNPRLAACVRQLELFSEQDEFTKVIPTHAETTECLDGWVFESFEQARLVIENVMKAIRHMSNLRRFRWLIFDLVPEILEAVSSSCSKLEELAIVDTGRNYLRNNLDYPAIFSPFRNLKTFWYRATGSPCDSERSAQKKELFLALADLLSERCPTLEDLHLDIDTVEGSNEAPNILENACWPYLRRLAVHASIFQPIYQRFLTDHPLLEKLRINKLDPQFHNFDKLPRCGLTSLEVDRVYSADEMPTFSLGSEVEKITRFSLILKTRRIVPLPPGPRANIQAILERTAKIPASHLDFHFLSTFTLLQELVIKSDIHQTAQLATLLSVVPPTIQILIYEASHQPTYFRGREDLPHSFAFSQPISVLVPPLTRLNKLVRLGVINVQAPSQIDTNTQCICEDAGRVIEVVANACPTIEYLALGVSDVKDSTIWIQIRKTSSRDYASYSPVHGVGKNRLGIGIGHEATFRDADRFINASEPYEYWPCEDEDEDNQSGEGDAGDGSTSQEEEDDDD